MENFDDSSLKEFSSLPKENWWGDNYLIQYGDFWLLPPFVPSIDRVLKHFKPLPNDVILASFPKTGTTWLKSILYSITNRSSSKHALSQEHPHELVPTLEAQLYIKSDEPFTAKDPNITPNYDDGKDIVSESRRVFSTHIPYQLLAKTLESPCECKVVYVTRNPKDTLVSWWHFVNKWDYAKTHGPWSFEEAVDKFCDGLVPCGPYYEHALGYKKYSTEKPERAFFVTYEELKNDPKTHVERLAEFLGCPFEGEDKEAQVEEMVRMCSFDALSNYEKNKSQESPSWFDLPYNSFFRKGQVGHHKNYLSEENIQRIDKLTMEKFYSSGFNYGI